MEGAPALKTEYFYLVDAIKEILLMTCTQKSLSWTQQTPIQLKLLLRYLGNIMVLKIMSRILYGDQKVCHYREELLIVIVIMTLQKDSKSGKTFQILEMLAILSAI